MIGGLLGVFIFDIFVGGVVVGFYYLGIVDVVENFYNYVKCIDVIIEVS